VGGTIGKFFRRPIVSASKRSSNRHLRRMTVVRITRVDPGDSIDSCMSF
jgi:hypothetical protein